MLPYQGEPHTWETDELLHELARRSWLIYVHGDRSNPTAIVAVHRAEHWADVITLWGHDRATAYRAPLRPTDNPLRARWVIWHYVADAVWTMRAALTITPAALSEYPYPIPDSCRPPAGDQRPMTIRPGGLLTSGGRCR